MDARPPAIDALLTRVYRAEHGRIVATLIRVLGDFDLAEEVAHDAFAAALEQWPQSAPPPNPAAWLVQTARNKAIDRARRRSIGKRKMLEAQVLAEVEASFVPESTDEEAAVEDDRLRLMFTCCHPALAAEARVALTLRTLGGLTTEEIARAFLLPAPTMAQRLVRAKAKIRDANIPYRIPPKEQLPERLEAVMAVVYLIFSEGYAASAGDELIRRDLCNEAIRLGELLARLVPDSAEVEGLCALMLLHDSRRDARVDAVGDIVLLEDQDRALWDRDEIASGLARVVASLKKSRGRPGAYALQAAIAGCHARARDKSETDWREIAVLYEILAAVHPSPVVRLNRAVAIAMARGAEEGLLAVEAVAAEGDLEQYHLLHAARADLLRRLGRSQAALLSYEKAHSLAQAGPERRFLLRRMAEVGATLGRSS